MIKAQPHARWFTTPAMMRTPAAQIGSDDEITIMHFVDGECHAQRIYFKYATPEMWIGLCGHCTHQHVDNATCTWRKGHGIFAPDVHQPTTQAKDDDI